MPPIEVFRVASFYKAFSLIPRGRHLLTVCMGTACHVHGAPRLLDTVEEQLNISPSETTADKLISCMNAGTLHLCPMPSRVQNHF